MTTSRTEEEILDHAVELFESSSLRIAHAKDGVLLDERCFEGTRRAIESSRRYLQPACREKSD
jgi:hypothetical protein